MHMKNIARSIMKYRVKPHTSKLEKFARVYEKNPLLKALVQIVPYCGPIINSAIGAELNYINAERTKAFFDELLDGKIELTPELIKTEDFLHCYFATVNAALHTRRREKIKMYARLLCSGVSTKDISRTDEYEEYLCILSELSYREITVLCLLDEYEANNPAKQGENNAQQVDRYWDAFRNDMVKRLSISDEDINPIIVRLQRSGCFESLTGKVFQNIEQAGVLSAFYYKLKGLVKNKEGKFA